MIVLDASVVLKLLANEPGSDAAIARVSQEQDRAAPDRIDVEIAAALSKKVRFAGLPVAVAREYPAAVPLVLTDIVRHRAAARPGARSVDSLAPRVI